MNSSLDFVNLLLKTNHLLIDSFLIGFDNDQIVNITIRKKTIIINIGRFKDAALFRNSRLKIINIKTYYDISFTYTNYQKFTTFYNINIGRFSFKYNKRNLGLDVRDEV